MCWLYSLKHINLALIRTIPFKEALTTSEHLWKLAPLAGYIVFGVGNIIFFSMAMRKIPASTAFAIWLGVAMTMAKVIDITVFKEPYSFAQLLFILLILIGIVGLKVTES